MGESLIEKDLMFKQWVDSGADLDHLPICLDILRNPKKPSIPFKFCAAWLKHEEVLRLTHSKWIPYVEKFGSHVATHFVQNLARIKRLLKDWAKNKKFRRIKPLVILRQIWLKSTTHKGETSPHRKKSKDLSL